MSNYEYELGDKVYFLRTAGYDTSVKRDNLGVITSLLDIDESPFCYKATFMVDTGNDEDGIEAVSRKKTLHMDQIALVSNKYDFKEGQLVRVAGLDIESYVTGVARIMRFDNGKIWLNSGLDVTSYKFSTLMSAGYITPFTQLDIDNTEPNKIKRLLKTIAYRIDFNADADFSSCIVCADWLFNDGQVYVEQSGYLCRKCVADYEFLCSVCNVRHLIVDINMRILQGKKICSSCYDDRVYRCSGCSTTFIDESYDEYDSGRYCKPCFENRAINVMSNPPRMISRSRINKMALPPEKIYLVNKSKTPIAIEIEAISPFDTYEEEQGYQYPHGWNDVYDASIDSEAGREFIMEPEVGDDALRKIKDFCGWLRNEDFYVNNSCGLHVHTDAYYLGIKELKGILIVVRALEPFIYKMIPKHRELSRYSSPMKEFPSDLILDVKSVREFCILWYKTMNDTRATSEKYNESRYNGLNLHSRFLHGTVEYRYHHGTLSHYHITNWVLFCLAMSDYGSKLLYQDNESKLNLFLNKESKDFSDYLDVMGASSLIPYTEEMIKDNSPEDDSNEDAVDWATYD